MKTYKGTAQEETQNVSSDEKKVMEKVKEQTTLPLTSEFSESTEIEQPRR